MSKKWRSSKKLLVDGDAFKRERLAFKSRDERPMRGVAGHGSQAWLSEYARDNGILVSPRTINALETGNATLKTVDAISRILNIKGRKYIEGYGEDSIKFRVHSVVDFRSCVSGRVPGNETAYLSEAFLITLIPIKIEIEDDFIDTVLLKNIRLKLSVGDLKIDFVWIYNVNLTSRASTWLGDEEDVSDVLINICKPYEKSIMFRQDSIYPMSWKDFLINIKNTEDLRILLTVNLEFERFIKTDHVLVSVAEFINLTECSYPKGFPYWIEPKALMK